MWFLGFLDFGTEPLRCYTNNFGEMKPSQVVHETMVSLPGFRISAEYPATYLHVIEKE